MLGGTSPPGALVVLTPTGLARAGASAARDFPRYFPRYFPWLNEYFWTTRSSPGLAAAETDALEASPPPDL